MDPAVLEAVKSKTVDELINSAAEICAMEDKLRQSPFCAIAMKPDVSDEDLVRICNKFFEVGANCSQIDVYGQTPMFYACREGKEVMVKMFIEKGVDVNFRDTEMQTVAFYASREGRDGTLKLLKDAGIDLNAADKIGQTAIFYAARHNRASTIRLLVELGADHKHKDLQKRSAAMLAKSFRQKDALHALSNPNKKSTGTSSNAQNQKLRRRIPPIPRRGFSTKFRVVSNVPISTATAHAALQPVPMASGLAANRNVGGTQWAAGVRSLGELTGVTYGSWVNATPQALLMLSEVPSVRAHGPNGIRPGVPGTPAGSFVGY